jgi:hypothetical protein
VPYGIHVNTTTSPITVTYNEKLPVCDTSMSSNNDDDGEKDPGDTRMNAYDIDRY